MDHMSHASCYCSTVQNIKDETYAIVDRNGLKDSEFHTRFSNRLELSLKFAYPQHFNDIIEQTKHIDHNIAQLGKTFLNVDLHTGVCTIITLVGSETCRWYRHIVTSYRCGKEEFVTTKPHGWTESRHVHELGGTVLAMHWHYTGNAQLKHVYMRLHGKPHVWMSPNCDRLLFQLPQTVLIDRIIYTDQVTPEECPWIAGNIVGRSKN
jgi:hypothetical protein